MRARNWRAHSGSFGPGSWWSRKSLSTSSTLTSFIWFHNALIACLVLTAFSLPKPEGGEKKAQGLIRPYRVAALTNMYHVPQM